MSFHKLLLVSLLTSASLFAETPTKPIAAALQPFVDRHELAGAVTLVATKDKVLDVETVGWADIAAKKPMGKDALFWIASMSKAITAAAFMILVDEGKVKLDDPVEKYLPEFKGQMVVAEKDVDHVLLKKPKHPITIRNVLSHTSGL
jgi:CubicO group peptidase (beta-lactamase class C family)